MSAGPRFWWVVAGVVVAGAALHAPSIGSGLAADDHLQRAMLDGTYPVPRHVLDLYSFVRADRGELGPLQDAGVMPWWSHPELRLAALRPLASALIAGEHALGLGPLGRHLHSLAWYGAAVVAAAHLLRRLVGAPAAAMATLAFAVDPAHVMPLGWLANRPALAAAALGLAAVSAHVAHRSRSPGTSMASATLFTAALLAGEYAFGALAYVVTWELAAGPGQSRCRIASALAFAVPGFFYAALHVGLGYGARGSAVYLDPIAEPLASLGALPGRLAALVWTEAGGAVAISKVGAGLALVALVPLAVVLPRAARVMSCPREVTALALGALLGMLPVAATAPNVRLLVLPSVGGAACIAVVVASAVLRRDGRLVTLAAAALVGVTHFVVAPLETAAQSRAWRALTDGARARYAASDLSADAGVTNVLVGGLHLFDVLYPPFERRAAGHETSATWRILATSAATLTVERAGDRTLIVAAEGGALCVDQTAVLFRAPSAELSPGDTTSAAGLRVRVLEAGPAGPTRIAFEFDHDLDAPRLRWLASAPDRLRRASLPARGRPASAP